MKPIYDAGMDVQSHTKTHYDKNAQKYITTGQLIGEYSQPLSAIGAQTLAYPEGLMTYDPENYETSDRGVPYDSKAYASKYYIAARDVTGNVNMPNKTGILGQQQSMDYMDVSSQSTSETTPTTTKTHSWWALEDLVKSLYRDDYTYKGQVNIGGWGCIHTHSLSRKTTANPSYPEKEVTGADIVEDVLKYLDEAGANVWNDSFTNIAKYGQERDSATLTVTSETDNEIKYTLTDKMDDTIFDYPVTVMVKIPSAWTEVTAMQNGKELEATVNSDGYAYVETIPDRGEVTVAPPSAPANLVTVFYDDFEDYVPNSFITNTDSNKDDPKAKWRQTQGNAFYAVADPDNSGNQIGKMGAESGGWCTNRTQSYPFTEKTHIVSGRVKLNTSYLQLNLANIQRLLYFYKKNDSNNSTVIMNANYGWIAKWVPDKWVDFQLRIEPNTSDLAQSTVTIYLSSTDGGLTDTNGTPITEATNTCTVDMTAQAEKNPSDMFRFDSSMDVTTPPNYIYLDNIKIAREEAPQKMEMSLNLSSVSIPLDANFDYILTPTVTPAKDDIGGFTWTSSNEEVATVDQNGKITPVSGGNAVITATAKNYNLSASCTVTVMDTLATVFDDDFESYAADSLILAKDRDKNNPDAKWQQTQADSFFAVTDPDNSGNKLGEVKGSGSGLYSTNRTPSFPVTSAKHLISGRIKMGTELGSYSKLKLRNTDNLLFFYQNLNNPSNENDRAVICMKGNGGWAHIAKWVPGKWIDFKLLLEPNTSDLTKSKTTVYLSGRDGGLTDKEGNPIPGIINENTLDLSSQANANPTDMFYFDSWVTASNTVHYDNIKIEESIEVYLDPASLNIPLDLGLECKIKTVVLPSGNAAPSLTWTSSNEAVATVDQTGNVTPVGVGSAVITATGNGVNSSCNVTVTPTRAENQKLNLSVDERPDINVEETLKYPTDAETAKIALWKNNSKGAFSITTDDGTLHENCFSTWLDLCQKYNRKVTFFPWTKEASTTYFQTKMKPLYDAGMDIQSHSKNHYDRHAQKFLSTAQVIEEYYHPVSSIGAQVLAYPEGIQPYRENPNYEDPDDRGVPYDQKAYASKYYIAARNGTGKVNMPNKTGLLGQQQSMDYMDVSSQSVSELSPTTTKTHDQWALEDLVKSLYSTDYVYKGQSNIGGWGVIHTHGILGSTTSNASHPGETVTGADVVEDVMKYLAEAGDNIWGDTFTNVAKYSQERDSATLTVTSASDSEIKYTLTDKMDDTIFN